MNAHPLPRVPERRARAPVAGAVVVLVAFLVAVLSLLVGRLGWNANDASARQAAIRLDGAARIAEQILVARQASLRARAVELAASRELGRAVATVDETAVARFASSHGVEIRLRTKTFGRRPTTPSLTSTALLVAERMPARITVTLPLSAATLASIRRQAAFPRGVALVVLSHGRVVARAPAAGPPLAGSSPIRIAGSGLSVAAAESAATAAGSVMSYWSRAALAAIATLLIAVAVAVRLARPVARRFGELNEQAERDPLTGIANRRLLDARLGEELERAARHATHLGFVLVDLDDFKQVNDRYGHQCGDEVLRAVAALLAESVRELDLAGRFGGEEFALVLPGTSAEGACRLAEQIRRSLRALDVAGPDGEPLSVTATFGAADFPTAGSAAALIDAADKALYEAKRAGKDRVGPSLHFVEQSL